METSSSSGFLNIRRGETRLVLVLILLLFSNSLALEISGVVAVSGFLQNVDANLFLAVWGVDMLLIILSAAFQSYFIDRFNRVRLVGATAIVYVIITICLRLMFLTRLPEGINYTLLYLLSDQQLLFFPVIFWLLANDLFNITQGRRLFPVIATGGFIGQIAGLGIAAVSPGLLAQLKLAPPDMLVLNCAIYVIAVTILFVGLRKVKTQQISATTSRFRETLAEGFKFVEEVPAFRYLMMAMLAMGFVLTVNEFHFFTTVGKSFAGQGDQITTFYSLYRLGIAILSVIMQAFITPRILGRVPLKNTFFVLPGVSLAGLLGMIGVPGLVTAAGGRGLAYFIFTTLDESARKSLQAFVPEARRGRVGMFMDNYLYATGTIAACIVMGIIVFLGSNFFPSLIPTIYIGAAIVVVIFALWAIWRMRTVYENTLWNPNLNRRRRSSAALDKLDFG